VYLYIHKHIFTNGGVILYAYIFHWGHSVLQLTEALRCKPEGRGLDSRCCHWKFSFT